ncbi:MAG: hypothetical protein D6820_00690 [Lentisphaerae bacterium]|nr:MAG: hypothetical protein D6820_00690 [Lentisphaerota bacterium]
MIVEFEIKGVTKRKETYDFSRVVEEDEGPWDCGFPESLYADGLGGGYNLSFDILEIDHTGITYLVSYYFRSTGNRAR